MNRGIETTTPLNLNNYVFNRTHFLHALKPCRLYGAKHILLFINNAFIINNWDNLLQTVAVPPFEISIHFLEHGIDNVGGYDLGEWYFMLNS